MNKEDKFYYKDGTTSSKYDPNKVLHRLDGPAVEEEDGGTWWFEDDTYHRLDGPAIELSDGSKLYYINNEFLLEQEWKEHPKVLEYNKAKVIRVSSDK